ncbi:cyclin-L1-1 [Curcuma longa]|uniref:cyclin-L1-1 n=1 Tax=Curcuma longa TaxID=136217 RepID=UPI003D9DB41A
MIYTGIDTFYLTEEQLKSSPSRKDGIHEETETTLRIYGCDLIQESGILLKLPQAVMATGQVLFHRFYCKKSFARFSVKRVAASCVWLASKLEECPKKAKHIIVVFHRMECRRENLPIEPFDFHSKKYTELKNDLVRTEGHLLKEMGFICQVEHPHKFISNYLATLDASPEMRQEAWNLANDSLRTTLCVRFKSEVVACGVVYAAVRRFQVPLPESPPWWEVFDADKAGIDEVCRVLAHLYSLPKAQCIAVYKDNDSFTSRSKNPDQQAQVHKESLLNGEPKETSTPKSKAPTPDGSLPKETTVKASKIDQKVDVDRNRDRDRERTKTRERDSRGRDSDYDGRSRDLDRDRERDKDLEHERERRHHRAKGHSEKLRHHSSRDRSEYHSSRSSREKDRYEKDRHRHHPYR